ncbi:hypothetical protein FIE12Z_7439 [Fusarium flagelliforme]|uniref:C2H2-type domain-containing protein n=1 Tax=Fusarium flagelliforme TaxID=2675880 RepID=A0A395MJZ3_9HYPO|nr:hypothetical protein FIE12Z_7439 [Fusarium flagelliforme]
MPDPIDASTQHGAGDSNNGAGPTKPSLRILDLGSSSHATREEDLANGPLLLGLGYGQEDHIPYPEMAMSSQTSEQERSEDIILPLMPLRMPRVLATESVTVPTASQSGPSFSTTTESLAPATQSVLEKLSELKKQRVALFPWSFEFSWQDCGLCFGDELLEHTKTPGDHYSRANPGSERTLLQAHDLTTEFTAHDVLDDDFVPPSMAGVGGFLEHSSLTGYLEDLEVASSLSSILDSDVATEAFEKDLLMKRFTDWAIEQLVDDFFRSHAPRSSKGRATGTSQQNIQVASDNRANGSQGIGRQGNARPNGGKRKALGGDEGSEDENYEDKKRKRSGTEVVEDTQRWACPFVKWNPDIFKCGVGPKTITELKGHIERIHWVAHCRKCWMGYPKGQDDLDHGCFPTETRSNVLPGFITHEMRNEIRQRETSRLSHEQQWHRIYSVLFPNERCDNPYLDKANDKSFWTVENWVSQSTNQKRIEELLSQSELRGKYRKEARHVIYDGIFPMLIQDCDRRDEECTELTQDASRDESPEVEPPAGGLIEGSGSEEPTTALDSMPQPFQLCHGETDALEPAQQSMLDLQTFAEELPADSNTLGYSLNLTEPEDPLGSFKPEYSQFYLSETPSMPSDVNLDSDFQFSGLNPNETQSGTMMEMNDFNWPDLSAMMSFPDELQL